MPDESRPSQPRRQLVPEGTARAGRSLRKAAAFGLQCLIGIPLLLIALTMIFGPPVSLICETIDLCRMRERTTGRVDAVGVQSGNHGATRPHIEHHFTANGREVHSTRYAPGFVANLGSLDRRSEGSAQLSHRPASHRLFQCVAAPAMCPGIRLVLLVRGIYRDFWWIRVAGDGRQIAAPGRETRGLGVRRSCVRRLWFRIDLCWTACRARAGTSVASLGMGGCSCRCAVVVLLPADQRCPGTNAFAAEE